ncbi:MAG: DUF1345 domain-containing protein [Ginsengibacter sp.]
MQRKKEKVPYLDRSNSFQKISVCLMIGLLVYFFFSNQNIPPLTHIMIGWDSFCLCLIVFHWTTFYITDSKQIRTQSKIQDSKGSIIFIIILIATLASFLAVLLLILTKKQNQHVPIQIPVAILGMLFSWILIHTIFTIRYAHIFYGDHESLPNVHAGGLDFPNEKKPDFLDFAYFSFVLGMTFQVSDVQVTSKRIRRLAMFHGLIAFGFNTIMIALTINLIAGS